MGPTGWACRSTAVIIIDGGKHRGAIPAFGPDQPLNQWRKTMNTVTMHKTQPVNGIDVDALMRTIEAVRDDAANGQVAFRVKSAWKGQTRSETTVESYDIGGKTVPRRFAIKVDEPLELCGENTAPNPQEMLMTALNTCMLVGYVASCAVRGIRLDMLEIETSGTLDLRGFLGLDAMVPPGYEAIRTRIVIKGSGTPAEFREIHETVLKTSPNYFNVSRPIRVDATLDIRA
jgi:uncharacterized OsmC-like protein